MKPNTHHDISHEGDLQVMEEVALSLDASALVHLMSVLTDLYSDPEAAVIREYSTNARDSHIAAGKGDVPIEVSLPSELDPVFRVTDHGVGLSPNDIRDIFSKYGASTKRDNDEETGTLGLGCKSALTYSPSFTLVCVKGGVKTTAVVSRGTNGAGTIRIVDTSATTEDNGVQVQVPVTDVSSFVSTAEGFYRYWKPGTVLVNGEAPNHPEGEWIDPDVLVTKGSQDIVVMGGVPYPVPNHESISRGMTGSVIAYVPMGSVCFTPSREALNFDTAGLTRSTLRTAREFVAERTNLVALKQVEQAATGSEAHRLVTGWRSVGKNLSFVWGARKVPAALKAKAIIYTPGGTGSRGRKVTNRDYVERAEVVGPQYVVVTGYTNKTLSPTSCRKTLQYADEHSTHYTRGFLFIDTLEALAPWVDPEEVGATIDWEDIKAVKLPSTGNGGGGVSRKEVSGSYIVVGDRGSKREVTEFDETKALVYYEVSEEEDSRRYGGYSRSQLAAYLVGEAVVVRLPGNRKEKFLRENPHAAHVTEYALAQAARAVKALTPEDAYHLKHEGDREKIHESLVDVPAAAVRDPEVARYIRVTQGVGYKSVAFDRYRWVRGLLETLSLGNAEELKVPKHRAKGFTPEPVLTTQEVTDRYPMLRALARHASYYQRATTKVSPQEVLAYLNDTYTIRATNQTKEV